MERIPVFQSVHGNATGGEGSSSLAVGPVSSPLTVT